MSIDRPYRRTARAFLDGTYPGNGNWRYVAHPLYAEAPEHYVRSFLLLLKDLKELFDYVEPADMNAACYSYRIHALLLRACVEVEANCKAILKENGYSRSGNWSMTDYKKIEVSHRLSSFKVVVPTWTGTESVRAPFEAWGGSSSLPWYAAYNATKHDRHSEFEKATFRHLVDACCAVFILLSAQFVNEDFSGFIQWERETRADGSASGIGSYFRIQSAPTWPESESYAFDWKALKVESDPFQQFDYNTI